MPLSTKIIRRRIRSVKNTKKVTKAMELVSASKMRRAVNAVLQSRAYSDTAWSAVEHLQKRVPSSKHPLLAKRPNPKKACFILMSSNRGLCGGFNTQITLQAMRFSETLGLESDWIVIGKKGADVLVRNKKNIIADFARPDAQVNAADISSAAKMIIDSFLNKTYDRIYLVYTDFVSAIAQKPRIKLLLPFEAQKDAELGQTHMGESEDIAAGHVLFGEYLFEPNAGLILDFFLKRLVEVQMYQAMLESLASEHASRMMSMRQASDAATDMIDDLTLIFNQARQAAITREIAEISGGKAALE